MMHAMEDEKRETPTRFQRAVCWTALTVLSLLTLIAIVCGILWGAYSAFAALKVVLLPFIIAGVLAYLLHPCVRCVQHWLEKLTGKKNSPEEKNKERHFRRVSVCMVLSAFLLALAALIMCVIPPLVTQTGLLIANRAAILNKAASVTRNFLDKNQTAQYIVDLVYEHTPLNEESSDDAPAPAPPQLAENDYTNKVLAVLEYYSGTFSDVLTRWLFEGTRVLYGSLGYLIGLVMIPLSLYYFLLNTVAISSNWQEVIPLPPGKFRNEVVDTLREINNYIIAFVRGQMLVSIIDGLLLGIALSILGLPYAVPIAAAAALLGIIPYLGTILTCIPALFIAWFYWQDVSYVLGVAAIFVAVGQFDGWFLQPKLLGKLVGMHDLTIMFSVLFWGSVLGGIVGALLAVPLTASIKVLLVRYVGASFGSQTSEKAQLRAAAPDSSQP